MKVNCPKCNTEYEIDDSMRGQKFNCTQEGCPGILAIPESENISTENPEGFDILSRMKSAFQKQIVCVISAVIALCIMFLFGWGWHKAGSSRVRASIEVFDYLDKCSDTEVDLSAYRQKCEILQGRSKFLQMEYSLAKSNLEEQEQKYAELNKKYKESEETLSAARARFEIAQEKLFSVEKRLKENKSLPLQYQNKLAEYKEIKATLFRIQSLINQYKNEQESFESKKSKLSSRLDNAKKKLAVARKELETAPSAAQIEDARKKYIAAKEAARPNSKKRIRSVGSWGIRNNFSGGSFRNNYDEKALSFKADRLFKKEQSALNEFESLQKERQQSEMKLSHAESYLIEVKLEYESLIKRPQELEHSIKTLEVKEKEFQKKYDKATNELQQLKAQLNTSGSSFSEWQKEYMELQSNVINYENLFAQATGQNKKLKEEMEYTKNQKERTAENYKNIGEELNRLAREHKEATQELDSLGTKLAEYKERCENARKEQHKYSKRMDVFFSLDLISLGIFTILLLLFLIFHLIFIYQGWRIIPRETAVTTPNKAIWLNFVPGLFPFWQWVTYFELGKAYTDLTGRRANKVLALIVSVMNFLGVWLISLPWIAIILVLQGELLRSAEIIVNNQTGEE